MNILIFLLSALAIFAVWDIWAHVTGRETMSRYVIHMAKRKPFWKWFITIFPVVLMLIAIWLVFHWLVPCQWFDYACGFKW